jgi:hypothetical protein
MPRLPWQAPADLAEGSPRQRAAWRALQALRLFPLLAEYTPALAGTLPLGIDLPESDLDVICAAFDLEAFAGRVAGHFGRMDGFRMARKRFNGLPAVVARFVIAGFPVEVFGQPRPVQEQNAYRHLLVEARLLEIGGPRARAEIRRLKAAGLKTEPAFARYFRLPGDPYETLLQLMDGWPVHGREQS